MTLDEQPEISRQLPPAVSGHKGLSRKRGRDTEEPTEPRKDGNVQGDRRKPKQSRKATSGFPCPFVKHDPTKYGGENGCASYSRSLGTVIRHHVLDKHLKEHQKAGAGKEEVFKLVEELWKSASSRQKGTEEGGRELWKEIYKVLFEVESSEEDNIPEPFVMSNSRKLDVDNIHALLVEMASINPSVTIEMVDLSETTEMLKRERKQARREVHRKAEEEIALIRDREAAEIRQLDEHYDVQLHDARARLKSRLSLASGLHIESGRAPYSVASLDNEGRLNDLAPHSMQALAIRGCESPSRSIAGPATSYGPHVAQPTFRNQSFTSLESVLQTPSDEGYQSRFGFCEHGALTDDGWCDACTSINSRWGV